MQTVAILANGPSLTTYWPSTGIEDYDIVIGVNTAAWLFPVDVWCVLDPEVIALAIPGTDADVQFGTARHTPLYNGRHKLPSIVATFEGMKGLQHLSNATRIDLPLYGKRKSQLQKPILGDTAIESANYTFPNAVALANIMAEGGQVDIYGMDITTEIDAAGKWGDRTAERWQRELPWIALSWCRHWRIFGRASDDVRSYLRGDIPFSTLQAQIQKMQGGQTHRKMKIVS